VPPRCCCCRRRPPRHRHRAAAEAGSTSRWPSRHRWLRSWRWLGGGRCDCAGVSQVLCGMSLPQRTYHSGHVPDTLRSQGSTQAGWKVWLQGSKRTSWPRSKSSVQMEQPSVSLSAGSGSGEMAVEASAVWIVSVSSVTSLVATSADWACDKGRGPAPAISTSGGSSSSRSPNLTIGMVSSMARARPLARLWRGRPWPVRGPYRSGWR
jgi:hypothetical protein